MNLIEQARRRMRRIRLEHTLEEGRFAHWAGNIDKATLLLLDLDDEVIQEPPFNSEEYRNGERKPETPDDESQEEEISIYENGDGVVYDEIGPERDDEGYLIR